VKYIIAIVILLPKGRKYKNT